MKWSLRMCLKWQWKNEQNCFLVGFYPIQIVQDFSYKQKNQVTYDHHHNSAESPLMLFHSLQVTVTLPWPKWRPSHSYLHKYAPFGCIIMYSILSLSNFSIINIGILMFFFCVFISISIFWFLRQNYYSNTTLFFVFVVLIFLTIDLAFRMFASFHSKSCLLVVLKYST